MSKLAALLAACIGFGAGAVHAVPFRPMPSDVVALTGPLPLSLSHEVCPEGSSPNILRIDTNHLVSLRVEFDRNGGALVTPTETYLLDEVVVSVAYHCGPQTLGVGS
jgi:hypothetical protein